MQIYGNNGIEQYCHQSVHNVAIGETLALGIEQEYHRHDAYCNPKERIVAYRKVEAADDEERGCNEWDIFYSVIHYFKVAPSPVLRLARDQ